MELIRRRKCVGNMCMGMAWKRSEPDWTELLGWSTCLWMDVALSGECGVFSFSGVEFIKRWVA